MGRKEKIPSTVRNSVWVVYIGKEKRKGLCFCCGAEDISFANFHCGHVQSEKCGGKVTIDNLRPVCAQCNSSMGVANMLEFMEKFGFAKPEGWDGVEKTQDRSLVRLPITELKYICKAHGLLQPNTKRELIDLIRFNIRDFDHETFLWRELEIFRSWDLDKICKDYEIRPCENRESVIKSLVSERILLSDYEKGGGTIIPYLTGDSYAGTAVSYVTSLLSKLRFN